MPDAAPAETIVVAAVCVRDGAGRLLAVRKRGTARFMLPGGKLEVGEGPDAAAARELAEEVGVTVDVADLVLLGRFESAAANEPGALLVSTVYAWQGAVAAAEAVVAAEIEELRWLDPADPDLPDDALAPMLREHVLPRLRDGWPDDRPDDRPAPGASA